MLHGTIPRVMPHTGTQKSLPFCQGLCQLRPSRRGPRQVFSSSVKDMLLPRWSVTVPEGSQQLTQSGVAGPPGLFCWLPACPASEDRGWLPTARVTFATGQPSPRKPLVALPCP